MERDASALDGRMSGIVERYGRDDLWARRLGEIHERNGIGAGIEDPRTRGLAAGGTFEGDALGLGSQLCAPSTAPLDASTVKILFEPAAVATSIESSSLIWIAYGVARAMPGSGCLGGSGSRSKNFGESGESFWKAMLVIRFRKARFSSSLRPCFLVPARPFASLRAHRSVR